MASARILAVVLLLSLAAVAQNQQAVAYSAPPMSPVDSSLFAPSDPFTGTLLPLPLDSQKALLEPKTSINPLEELPNSSENALPGTEANRRVEDIARYLASHGLDPNSQPLTTKVSRQGKTTLEADEVCYYIRSYLMARDSKDSDSTHLVGVSTCQPARQYGLKTTDLRSHAVQR